MPSFAVARFLYFVSLRSSGYFEFDKGVCQGKRIFDAVYIPAGLHGILGLASQNLKIQNTWAPGKATSRNTCRHRIANVLDRRCGKPKNGFLRRRD